MMSGDNLCASECFLSSMERCEPDSEAEGWASSAFLAWEARRDATPCGSRDIFCDCQRCAALPEKAAWMRSRQALVATAERVVAAMPEEATAWEMHGTRPMRHGGTDWSTASKSFMRAAKFSGESGDAILPWCMEGKARLSEVAPAQCLEHLRENS